ncbi:phage terminase large subunit family protein [Paenibacillus larvae]|nr:terminase gpA endonuclease subunit [Paenibacillus larvae]MDT2239101.1 phage terminase large subunit family protein [Paenibacillus larvae]
MKGNQKSCPSYNRSQASGYCHFPLTTRDKDRGYNEEYFDGLTAEEVRTRYKMGVPYQVWVRHGVETNRLILQFTIEQPLRSYSPIWINLCLHQGKKLLALHLNRNASDGE